MLKDLTTEARNPASEDLDKLSTIDFVRLVNGEDAKLAAAVAEQAEQIADAIDLIVARLERGGRLIYIGAGTSGRLGVLDASECPPTFNTEPGRVIALIAGGSKALRQAIEGAEDAADEGAGDLQEIKLDARDVVVGITASGTAPYVLGGMQYARAIGASTIAISCNHGSPVSTKATIAISVVVGPEVLSGSTRMKAGTATKMVLNMLSTGAMVKLGKTYGNLMVDLQATNTKLMVRAKKIVQQVTGLSPEAAEELMSSCGGDVKTAVVSHQTGTTPAEARARLDSVGGRLRAALEPE
jgi:N-acetylmuramic acid 6-phosphate etherase